MIRLYDMNRRLADIEMIDGKMHVVSYAGDGVERSLESVRRCYSPRKGPIKNFTMYCLRDYAGRFARSTLRVEGTRLVGLDVFPACAVNCTR